MNPYELMTIPQRCKIIQVLTVAHDPQTLMETRVEIFRRLGLIFGRSKEAASEAGRWCGGFLKCGYPQMDGW